jgi:hypothetical protein
MTSATISDQGKWISPARFRLAISGIDGGEIDYGEFWGSRHDQRVALRMTANDQAGVLYAYDPLWDEYRIIAQHVTRREAAAAVGEVAEILGTLGLSVGVLADTVHDRLSRVPPTAARAAASIEVGP